MFLQSVLKVLFSATIQPFLSYWLLTLSSQFYHRHFSVAILSSQLSLQISPQPSIEKNICTIKCFFHDDGVAWIAEKKEKPFIFK